MTDAELYRSFDARVWSQQFIETVSKNPSIATDPETMTSWFANALMRGYDEHYCNSKEYKRSVRRALYPWWKRFLVRI